VRSEPVSRTLDKATLSPDDHSQQVYEAQANRRKSVLAAAMPSYL